MPDDFYSTTNLATFVTVDGAEIPVAGEAMDLGIAVDPAGRRAWEVPMDEARAGQLFVVGSAGIRVTPLPRAQPPERGFRLHGQRGFRGETPAPASGGAGGRP